MANIFVDSAAAGAANGTTKTDAFTTLAAALAVWTSADNIRVNYTHVDGVTGATTLSKASPGAAVPVHSIKFSDDTYLAGALINCTTDMTVDGDLHVDGLTFRHSTGGTSTGQNISSTANGMAIYRNCRFEVAGGASSILVTGVRASGAVRARSIFINCWIKFSNVGQLWTLGRGRSTWIGGGIDPAGTIPTVVISQDSTYGQLSGGWHEFFGFDFSAVGAAKTLFSASYATNTYHLVNCKLNASLGTLLGTNQDAAACRLILTNTGSTNNNYTYKVTEYGGTVDINTTQYITSGSSAATDGTTQYSWMVTGSAGASLFQPFHTEWIRVWNEVTGSAQTVTLEILVDAAAGLTDEQAWIEIMTLDNAGDQLSTFHDDRRAYPTAAATQATGVGAASWTKGTAATGWISQKLTTTFTAQKKGDVYARVCSATTTPFYVNPFPVVA